MINSTDLRAGTTFLSDGQPYIVLKYNFIKMGRGSATVKVRARNLISGAVTDKSFTSNNVVENIQTIKRRLQYLYKDGGNVYFMDQRTYDQISIPLRVLGDQVAFLKEGGEADVLFWPFDSAQGKEDQALSVELPPKMTLTVTEADPGVKGNSASNIYKSAVLENGLAVKVPLFINKGEKVVVDTRTGEYIERASVERA